MPVPHEESATAEIGSVAFEVTFAVHSFEQATAVKDVQDMQVDTVVVCLLSLRTDLPDDQLAACTRALVRAAELRQAEDVARRIEANSAL